MKFFDCLKKWLSPLKSLWEKARTPHIEEPREEIGGVLRRPVSPWARRRWRHRRSNHPWVRR